MKMDTKGIDPRIILSERFRSAQEVMDHGFQIVGSGITFPGDGVKFTGAAGQRLVLPQCPNNSLLPTAWSVHISFTPAFVKGISGTYAFYTQETGHGGLYITANETFRANVIGISSSAGGAAPGYADWSPYWRDLTKNYVSYTIYNGAQIMWINGVQVSRGYVGSVMPPTTSNIARALVVGCFASAGSFGNVFNGTIHAIDWFNTTMTIEDHLDFMHNDTYSEIF
jgi:hypothetical protein